MVSDASKKEKVGSIVKEYESVSGAKINVNKQVGGISTGNLERQVDAVKRWTDWSVKLLGVWFDPALQVDNSWEEVTNRITFLI